MANVDYAAWQADVVQRLKDEAVGYMGSQGDWHYWNNMNKSYSDGRVCYAFNTPTRILNRAAFYAALMAEATSVAALSTAAANTSAFAARMGTYAQVPLADILGLVAGGTVSRT
jgi:hypothetical protein